MFDFKEGESYLGSFIKENCTVDLFSKYWEADCKSPLDDAYYFIVGEELVRDLVKSPNPETLKVMSLADHKVSYSGAVIKKWLVKNTNPTLNKEKASLFKKRKIIDKNKKYFIKRKPNGEVELREDTVK